MDKDNLDVGKILFHLNHRTAETERSEILQQAISALLMMCLGLVLTVAGLVVVLLRLMHLASCSLSILMQRLGVIQCVVPATGRSRLQKFCTDYHRLPHIQQTHAADNLKRQKMNHSLRNFTQRKRLSARMAP